MMDSDLCIYSFIHFIKSSVPTYMYLGTYLGSVVLDTKVSVIYHFNLFSLDTDLRQLSLSSSHPPSSL